MNCCFMHHLYKLLKVHVHIIYAAVLQQGWHVDFKIKHIKQQSKQQKNMDLDIVKHSVYSTLICSKHTSFYSVLYDIPFFLVCPEKKYFYI